MLTRTRILGAALMMALLTGAAGTALAQATPQTTQPLTGWAAINAVIGNTVEIEGKTGGKGSIYFSLGGMARASDPAERQQRWYATGGILCVAEEGKPIRPSECVAVVVTGDTVEFMEGTRNVGRGRIVRGNPKDL